MPSPVITEAPSSGPILTSDLKGLRLAALRKGLGTEVAIRWSQIQAIAKNKVEDYAEENLGEALQNIQGLCAQIHQLIHEMKKP